MTKPADYIEPVPSWQGELRALNNTERMVFGFLRRRASIQELVEATGLAEDQLRSIVLRLQELGAVKPATSVSGVSTISVRPSAPPSSRGVASSHLDRSDPPPLNRTAMSNSVEINPDDLEPTIDIELALQKRILVFQARLEKEDHYALLGVARDADKQQIKSAYFTLMNEFHADKFYGKNIGNFGPRLRRIVEVLTRASDTLGRKKTRAEYDTYLESRSDTIGARHSVVPQSAASERPARPSRPAVAPIDFVPQIPKPARVPQIGPDADDSHSASGTYRTAQESSTGFTTRPTQPAPPPNAAATASTDALRQPAPARPSPSQRPPAVEQSSGRPTPTSARNPAHADAARRLLAKKMGLRGAATRVESTPDVTPRDAVAADLKARYDARNRVRDSKFDALLDKSVEAQNAGDWSGALTALKLAQGIRPEDPQVHIRLEQTQAAADRALAPRFLEQARYEEKQRDYERAARSYELAARGKDSAELFNRSALCLLHLHQHTAEHKRALVEVARSAVKRDISKVAYRLTLAKAYDVAGMKTSALGEVQRALELEPENKEAKLLQKELK